jgi:hypothetical protein
VRQDRPRHVHDSKDIHVELLLDLFPGNGLEQADDTEARVVDEYVDSPETRDAGLDCLIDASPILNVQGESSARRRAS